jgi:hypothetical protein
MNLTNLLILQLIAHLFAEFNFQPDKWSHDKIDNGIKSKKFQLHLLVVFILSWILSLQVNFIFASIAITIVHFLIDAIKESLVNNKKLNKSTFFIDQVLHLSSIAGITYLFTINFSINPLNIFTFNTNIKP